MNNFPIFVEYKDDSHFIRLLKEKHLDDNGAPLLVGNCQFTLCHDLADERPLQGLSYVEAMMLWVGLLAELVEIHTEQSDRYPFTKEQFTALVNFYTQADAPLLSDVLSSSLSKESTNLDL